MKTEPAMKASSTSGKPRVWLVGAGPGHAELLTLQAVRVLRRASVVLVDDLVSDDVLRWVRRSAGGLWTGVGGGVNPLLFGGEDAVLHAPLRT